MPPPCQPAHGLREFSGAASHARPICYCFRSAAISSGQRLRDGRRPGRDHRLWGTTSNVNLAAVHPTAVSSPGSNAFLTRLDNHGSTLQSTVLNAPPNFLPVTPIFFNSNGAYLLSRGYPAVKIVSLGPSPSEIALICIGSAASFSNARSRPIKSSVSVAMALVPPSRLWDSRTQMACITSSYHRM